jgi:hypothetical protein
MAYVTKFDGSTDKTVTLGKEGDPKSIEGYFLGSKVTPDTGYGEGKLHIFQTEEGSVGIWGKTRLNTLLTSDIVGQMTLVTFTGMIMPKTKGRRPSYGFKVQHDPSNKIDTSNINLSASLPADEDDGEEDNLNSSEETYASKAPAPRAPANAPDAEKRARVQALLTGKR